MEHSPSSVTTGFLFKIGGFTIEATAANLDISLPLPVGKRGMKFSNSAPEKVSGPSHTQILSRLPSGRLRSEPYKLTKALTRILTARMVHGMGVSSEPRFKFPS